MPVNNTSQIQYNTTNANRGSNTPPPAPQGKLFSQELESSNSKNTLQNAANHTGLSQLANDDNSWHSLMGQTYGYDQSDSEGEAYTESETLRQDVLDGNWEDLGITVSQVKGDLEANAAFVGGDTADASDDGILITSETSDADIIEEVFHAFERKINPDQEGDTRLVNDTVTFTNDESAIASEATALDEGELGRTLLAEFNQSGEVPASDTVLATGDITSDDTSIVTLNGETVSLENATTDVNRTASAIANDDPTVNGEIYAAMQEDNVNNINLALTDNFMMEFNEDGSRRYADMASVYNTITGDISAENSPADYLFSLNSHLKIGSQGIQDYVGYAARHDPTVADDIARDMANGAGAELLNNFTYEQLNGEQTGLQLNPEVLQYFPAEELLSLEGDKSSTFAVLHALNLKLDSDEAGRDDALEAFAAIDTEAFGTALGDNIAYAHEDLQTLLPHLINTVQPDPHIDRGGQYAAFAGSAYSVLPLSNADGTQDADVNITVGSKEYTFEWQDGGDMNPVDNATAYGYNRDYNIYYNEALDQAVVAWKGTDSWKDMQTDIRAGLATQFSDEAIFGEQTEGNPLFVDGAITSGHGFVERIEHPQDGADDLTYQDNIHQVLDGLGASSVVFTGHSLGASTAQISGFAYATHTQQSTTADWSDAIPLVHVEAYNPPKAGNQAFVDAYQSLEESAYFSSEAYIRNGDPVSTLGATIGIWSGAPGLAADNAEGFDYYITKDNLKGAQQLDTSATYLREPVSSWHNHITGLNNHDMNWWDQTTTELFG